MSYGFGTTHKEHTDSLVRILHEWRWSDELPETVGPWNVNLMLETAVDEIRYLESQLQDLRAGVRQVVRANDTDEGAIGEASLAGERAAEAIRRALSEAE